MGQTPSQVVNNINSSITNVVTNAVSDVCNNVTISNTIHASCTGDYSTSLQSAWLTCQTNVEALVAEGKATIQDVKDTCDPVLSLCTITNIKLNQTIMWSGTVHTDTIVSNITDSSIKNAIQQYQNDSTSQDINSLSEIVINSKQDLVNSIINDTSAVQDLTVVGVGAKFISMDQAANLVTSSLSTIKGYSETVNSIANTITQTSQKTYNNILTAGAIIIGLFILLFLIVTFMKSKDITDFFSKTLPFLIFLTGAFIISLALLATKPEYVTYVDENGNKVIDKSKFLLYLSIYFISLIVLIWVVFFVKSKIES